jgi:hypothetical protein
MNPASLSLSPFDKLWRIKLDIKIYSRHQQDNDDAHKIGLSEREKRKRKVEECNLHKQ